MVRDNAGDIAIFLVVGGSMLYYHGLVKNKLRRRILDTPSSKIGSTAIGSNVEIEGFVMNMVGDGVISPLTGVQGAAFIWSVEEQVDRDLWANRFTFYSTPYLYLHDGDEHVAAVDLTVCEFQKDFPSHFEEFDIKKKDVPDKVKSFLSQIWKLDPTKNESFFSGQRYRFWERNFTYNQKLYVLGSATTCPDIEAPVIRFSKTIFKYDDSLLKMTMGFFNRKKFEHVVDNTKNAPILLEIENEILVKKGMNSINENVKKPGLLITKDDLASGVFKLNKIYVSIQSEKDLSFDLKMAVVLGVFGGPILIVLGLLALSLKSLLGK